MALIAVIGADAPLIEGVAQTLVAAGHQIVLAHDVPAAVEALGDSRPLVSVVDCAALPSQDFAFRIPLAYGGALVLFYCDDAEPVALSHAMQRGALARLQLPLERHRLLALVRSVDSRARVSGRIAADEEISAEGLT